MGALYRGLEAGLDGLIRALEALGARGTRWEWKKRAWRQGLELRIASWKNLERGVRAPLRVCPSCRLLVERSVGICPACGASLHGVPGGGVQRLLGLLLPESGAVSRLLVTANVLLSVIIYFVWGAEPGSGGLMRLLSPSGEALFLFGAKWTPAILDGQIWRLVTANYLHGGLVHLAFNCYTLMSLGPLIEASFGARKFFLVYTVTGIAAFATSAVVRPGSLSIGASGALFGLLGFAIVFGRFRAGSMGRAISDHLIRYLVYAGIMTLMIPGIDNAAHFGGLVAGGLLGLIVQAGPPRSRGGALLLNVLSAAALMATLGAFAAMVLAYAPTLRALQP